jgi:hypothetical protein
MGLNRKDIKGATNVEKCALDPVVNLLIVESCLLKNLKALFFRRFVMCKKLTCVLTLALMFCGIAAGDWVVLTSDDFESGWGF